MLYSYNGNYPKGIPNRIVLSDGSSRTDSSTFTAEELADAGYTQVENQPEYDSRTQKIEWDTENVSWKVVDLTSEEIEVITNNQWKSIRSERDALLSVTDYIILSSLERGEPVPQVWKDYRQALRDLPQTYETVDDVIWPDKPA